jgi:hypothetical protein
VPESSPADSVPPPLTALGGWYDAGWFSASVLDDAEVVGFQFPKLPGVRKQSFHVIERSATPPPAKGAKAKAAPAAPVAAPKRIAGKLALVLDLYGARQAVACAKRGFLFDSGPVLFFGVLPLAKLKARPANKLRRELIDIGLCGCVVQVDGTLATAMFWPAAEGDITDFVTAASPDVPLHGDFSQALAGPAAQPAAPKSRAKGGGVSNETKLLREIAALRQQIDSLKSAQTTVGAMEKLGLDDARLKSMLMLLHPDKHGGSEAANEAAKWLNSLREVLKSGRK